MTAPGQTVALRVRMDGASEVRRSTVDISNSFDRMTRQIDQATQQGSRSVDRMQDIVRRNAGQMDTQLQGAFTGMPRAADQSMDQVVRQIDQGMARLARQVDHSSRQSAQAIIDAYERAGRQSSQALQQHGQAGGTNYSRGVGSGAQAGAQGASDGFMKKFGGAAAAGIAVVAAAVGAVFVSAMKDALANSTELGRVQGSLGLTPEQAKKLGQQAGEAYAQGYGYGSDRADVTAKFGTAYSGLRGLNLDDTTMSTLTKQMISFEQTSGQTVDETSRKLSVLVNSGLVEDATKGFDLMVAASQRVPEALRGEVMDATEEYSQYARTLGLTGEQMFGLLVKGAEKGQYGIDKTGDSIKELSVRAVDGSKTTATAFETIGLNAKATSDAILTGGPAAAQATQDIIAGLGKIEDPSKKAQAALALFGTPLEDMNVQDIPAFVDSMATGATAMSDFAGAAAQQDAAMQGTVNGLERWWLTLKTKLVDWITDKVLPLLTEFGDWFNKTFGPAIDQAGKWIEGTLVPAFKKAWDWLSAKLGPTVEELSAFVTDDLIPAWQKFVEWWQTDGWPILEPIIKFVMDSIDNVKLVISGLIDFIGGILAGDWPRVWEGIKSIAAGAFQQIINLLQSFADFLKGVVTSIGPWIGEKLTELAGFLTQKGIELMVWIAQGVVAGATNLYVWFTQTLPASLFEWFQSLVDGATERGRELINWIGSGIYEGASNIWNWFTVTLPEEIYLKVSGLVESITERGRELIRWVAQGIVDGATAIWNWLSGGADNPDSLLGGIFAAVGGLMGKLKELGGQILTWIGEGIKNAAAEVWNAITWVFNQSGPTPSNGEEGSTTNNQSNPDMLNTPGYLQGGGGAGGGVAGARSTLGRLAAAAGGGTAGAGRVLPGYEPGVDVINAKLAPGESVMVPEWTRMVGIKNVYAMNRAARQGRYVPPNSFLGPELFATGGVAGIQSAARGVGAKVSQQIGAGIRAGKDPNSAASDVNFGSGPGGLFAGLLAFGKNIAVQMRQGMGTGAAGVVVMNGNIVVDGVTAGLPAGPRGEAMKAVASKMGTSYVWGAAGPDVFDCSGLMSWALQQAGIGKGRLTASGFHHTFPKVASPGKPGDMATFDTGRIPGDAGHIGMILDPARGLMMHTDGAGPARVGDYKSRNGGPLSIVDPIGGAVTPSSATLSQGKAGDPAPARANTIGSMISQIAGGIAGKFGYGLGGTGSAVAYNATGGVEQWRSLGLDVLRQVGQYRGMQLTGYIDRMLMQIGSESSGNPNAINNYDINAQRGDPSIGLLQVIGSTFRAALSGTPFAHLIAAGQRDPRASLTASTLYSLNRYGSLEKAWRGVAYEQGGGLPPGFTMAWNGTRQTETIVPVSPAQMYADTQAMLGHLTSPAGRGGGHTINVAQGAIVIQGSDLSPDELEEIVVAAMVRVAREDLDRSLS